LFIILLVSDIILDRYKHDIVSAGRNYNLVRKAICSGFVRNAAGTPKKATEDACDDLPRVDVEGLHDDEDRTDEE
jgi:hypothetical protein